MNNNKSPVPRYNNLKTIQDQISFQKKFLRIRDVTNNTSNSLQLPDGVFVKAKEERNLYRQWQGIDNLRKCEFNQNYLDLLDEKRNSNNSEWQDG